MNYHIVTIPKCPLCDISKNLLKGRGLEYTEEVLDTEKKREAFKAANPTIKVMPQVYENDVRIGSFSDLKKWFA